MDLGLETHPNTTDLSSFGLGVLMDTISCEVTEERNGVFEIVNTSTVKSTEKFRGEGVRRDTFLKGGSSDILKCSSCRNGLGIISPALFHRRKSPVGRVDPSQVVVMDVSVDHALYLIRCHFRRIHLVQLLLFQCSEKTLHSRVVVTSACATHALGRSVFFQAFAEYTACVLASPVTVQDHAARSVFLHAFSTAVQHSSAGRLVSM